MNPITLDQSARSLKKHVRALCTDIPSRMIGQPGDHASAQYVEDHYRGLGLTVLRNRMTCVGWDLESTRLEVDGRGFAAVGNMYSPAGKAAGTLVLTEPDVGIRELRPMKGAVVAVYGNFEPFPDRLNTFARNAERAGVAAVVVIDSDATVSSTKLIRDRGLRRMPVMSVSLETGYRIARLAGRTARCEVKARRYPSHTDDVIGVLPAGPREICIEAHRDAAPDTPSADDNGSGSVVLLELARLLQGTPLRRTVRFVSATAEEFGNVGTPVYAKKFARELERIDLMINADCVGGLLCPLKVYVPEKDPVAPLVDRFVRPYQPLRVVRTPGRHYGHIVDYLGPKASSFAVVCEWTNARIHTVKDEPASLSYPKLAKVAHFLRDVIVAFDRG